MFRTRSAYFTDNLASSRLVEKFPCHEVEEKKFFAEIEVLSSRDPARTDTRPSIFAAGGLAG